MTMQTQTSLIPGSTEELRKFFRLFNRFMVWMWRLGFGRYFNGTTFAGCIMVLRHQGRKSGKCYLTPVNFTPIDGDIYCMAGFGESCDWLQNIHSNPQVELWLPDGYWSGTAQVLEGAENRLAILRQLIIASGFAAPAFGIHLDRMSEQDLEKLLETYRLVRIRPTAALTGATGPGDLAWIWPYISLVLLLLLVFRRRRK